jgi:hypothetical protein
VIDKGIANLFGVINFRGPAGGLFTRIYHLYQLALRSQRLRERRPSFRLLRSRHGRHRHGGSSQGSDRRLVAPDALIAIGRGAANGRR